MAHQTSVAAISRPRRMVYHLGDIYNALSQLPIDNDVEDKEDNQPEEQPILCVEQYKEMELGNENRDQDEYDVDAVDEVRSECSDSVVSCDLFNLDNHKSEVEKPLLISFKEPKSTDFYGLFMEGS